MNDPDVAALEAHRDRPKRFGGRAAILLVLVIAGSLSALYAVPRIRRHIIPRELLGCATLTGSARDACFATRFQRVASGAEIHRELEALREMASERWLTDCHVPAHQLGTIAYSVKGTAAAQVKDASHLCGGGYAHAVAMASVPVALSAGLTLDSAVAQLCGSIPRKTRPYVVCSHGAGHGAFVASGESFPAAVNLCSALTADADRQQCISGAAMQNSMRYLGFDSTRYASAAASACVDAPEAHRPLCHEQIGEIAVFQWNQDSTRARATCALISDEQGRIQCMRGIDRMLAPLRRRVNRHWHHRMRLAINPAPPQTLPASGHAH